MTDHEFNVLLGQHLKRRREKSGLSMREMGRRMGVSNVSIVYWEQGKNSMNAATLKRYCDILNVPLNEFVNEMIKDMDQ